MRRRRQSSIKRDLYEYELDGYDMDAPITLKNRKTLVTAPKTRSIPLPTLRRPMPLLGAVNEDPSSDPLSPALFTGHHKRCEKDEKRLMEVERLRLVTMADRVLEQQRLLQGPYWQREIGNIVQIDNLHNLHEIRAKRRLALEEVGLFIRRFSAMEADRKSRQRRYTEPTQRKPPRPQKRKSMHLPTPPEPPREPKVWIYIPKRAFGVCMPQLSFRPQVFQLPPSWIPFEPNHPNDSPSPFS